MKPLGVAIGRGEKRYASPASDNLWLRSRRSQSGEPAGQDEPAFWLRARKDQGSDSVGKMSDQVVDLKTTRDSVLKPLFKVRAGEDRKKVI